MMKFQYAALATAALFWSVSGLAACDFPSDQVAVPDGASASEDEMVAAQQEVKAYMARVDDYLKCLDAEAAALGDAESDDQKLLHVKRHNAAVDAMEQLANNFNEQIRAFKARDN